MNLSLFEKVSYSTVRIVAKNTETRVSSVGTGFFYNLQLNEDTSILLLVTNKHVINGMRQCSFRMVGADESGNPTSRRIDIDVVFDKKPCIWCFHPDPKVDLCALLINPYIENFSSAGIKIAYSAFDNSVLPNESDLIDYDLVEDVFMIGYPNGLYDSVNNKPLVRKGITSTHLKDDYNGLREFVIDAACFPGSSGSPIVKYELGQRHDKFGNISFGSSRIKLLGILYAGPQIMVNGDIKVVNIPTLAQKITSESQIMMNLGYCIKSNRILDFIPMLKNIFNL